MMKKNRGFIFWFFLLGLCFVSAEGLAQEPGKLRGTITLVQETTKRINMPQQPNGPSVTDGFLDVHLRDTAVIAVCLEPGSWDGRAILVDRFFEVLDEPSFIRSQNPTNCPEWRENHPVQNSKLPGGKIKVGNQVNYKVFPEAGVNPKDGGASVTFFPAQESRNLNSKNMSQDTVRPYSSTKGKFTALVSVETLVGLSGSFTREAYDPCAQQTVRIRYDYRILPPGQEESVVLSGDGKLENKAVISLPAERGSLQGKWELDFDPSGFGGSAVVNQDDETKLTASWSFTPIDPCRDIREKINQELAYGETYLDKNTQQSKLDNFDKIVAKAAEEIWKKQRGSSSGGQSPQGQALADKEMGVSATCELVGEEEFRKKAEDQCRPEGEVAGVIVHERTHRLQCQHRSDQVQSGLSDNRVRGRLEAEAYLAGADVMVEWLENNCPQAEVKSYKQRIKALGQKIKQD